ncbi:MAG: hypothetical protein JWL84_529 [Rhodospirillales bacterium]|jgi:uncharacterized protein YceK|nr:hypothetical protein [Rhodospirillales bacterium]
MRQIALAIALTVALSGCTDAITMRNKATGEVATCGPYESNNRNALREAQCISDYQRQGYERAPH